MIELWLQAIPILVSDMPHKIIHLVFLIIMFLCEHA